MKRFITSMAVFTALLLTVLIDANPSTAQKKDEKTSGNDLVKLSSDAVEIVEVSDKAEKCPDAGGATFLRLRVKSQSPVDVRAHYARRGGRWAFSDYQNKKSGDEITNYECYPKAQFKVQTRPVGSDKWSKM